MYLTPSSYRYRLDGVKLVSLGYCHTPARQRKLTRQSTYPVARVSVTTMKRTARAPAR